MYVPFRLLPNRRRRPPSFSLRVHRDTTNYNTQPNWPDVVDLGRSVVLRSPSCARTSLLLQFRRFGETGRGPFSSLVLSPFPGLFVDVDWGVPVPPDLHPLFQTEGLPVTGFCLPGRPGSLYRLLVHPLSQWWKFVGVSISFVVLWWMISEWQFSFFSNTYVC